VTETTNDRRITLCHRLSTRQVEAILAGGRIPLLARG
jgi:aconitate hydratase